MPLHQATQRNRIPSSITNGLCARCHSTDSMVYYHIPCDAYYHAACYFRHSPCRDDQRPYDFADEEEPPNEH